MLNRKLLDTAPTAYTHERAAEIAKTLGEADVDWRYSVEPLRDVNGRRDARPDPKFVVRVTDEGGEFVAWWNEGDTVGVTRAPTPPNPPVQYVDYHGDEGVKTLREWALSGGLPSAKRWAKEHGESWVLKADGSGIRYRRSPNRGGFALKNFADVRPAALVAS